MRRLARATKKLREHGIQDLEVLAIGKFFYLAYTTTPAGMNQVMPGYIVLDACIKAALEGIRPRLEPAAQGEGKTGGVMRNCGHCHECGALLDATADGEEWCSVCGTDRHYYSHDWARANADDIASECPPLKRVLIIYSPSLVDVAKEHVTWLKTSGVEVYMPQMDARPDGNRDIRQVFEDNLSALRYSDVAHVFWDGVSQDALLVMGAALALGIPLFCCYKPTWTAWNMMRGNLVEVWE